MPLEARQPRASMWTALRGRCPHCGRGRIFRRMFAMNARCPICGLQFEREPGYFLGAMYFSYGLSIPLIGAALLAVSLVLPDLGWEWCVLLAGVVSLPFVPWLFRTSR